VEYFYVWPNTFSYSTIEPNPGRYILSDSKIVDANNNEINLEKLKGKVILFDIWHSACLPCIKQFPEIESLYNHYRSDTSVRIISLNFPLGKDKGIKPTRFTDSYSFEKMYFFNEKEYEKFSIEQVPLILIMDKNMKCRFAGNLNQGWNIFIGNVKKIINKLKKEK
jgi:thiol-disulfide isomerase/thioredoxin